MNLIEHERKPLQLYFTISLCADKEAFRVKIQTRDLTNTNHVYSQMGRSVIWMW
jgi:hypothetical protein